VDLTRVLQAVGALREARGGEDFVLFAPGVVHGLVRALPAADISFNDLDLCLRQSYAPALIPAGNNEGVYDDVFWEHFWDTMTACYTERVGRLRSEVMTTGDFYSDRQWHSTGMYADFHRRAGFEKSLIMPLPGPPGIARRLVFFRETGRAFDEEDRSAAILLQPHIANALRQQSRRAAARTLTTRQLDLLRLVAAGHDNTAIARKFELSPGTVRKHLENAFARLGVPSRTAAVAKVFPDITWR
jgi:DNA-binding CsgD family transcriptional regulator